MAIVFDAASAGGGGTAQSSLTYNHTCTGSNLFLVVNVAYFVGGGTTIASIKYNSVNMTKITTFDTGGGDKIDMWGLVGPSTGTNAVLITPTVAVDLGSMSASYTGVDQVTPTGTPNGATGTSTQSAVTVSSATGELVVDAYGDYRGDTVAHAGQSQRGYFNGGGLEPSCGLSDKAGAASVTMNWDLSGSDFWEVAAVSMKPTGGGGPTIVLMGQAFL